MMFKYITKIIRKRDFLTVKELANLLGISRIAVFNRIKKGQIKAQKVGRNYIINKGDIADLIGKELTDNEKKVLDKAVVRVVDEYGDVLKKLGAE